MRAIRRRVVIACALAALASPHTVSAQTATRIVRVGVLEPGGMSEQYRATFQDALRNLGSVNTDVVGKSLQLPAEVVPKLSRVAVLWNPSNPVAQTQLLEEVPPSLLARADQVIQ